MQRAPNDTPNLLLTCGSAVNTCLVLGSCSKHTSTRSSPPEAATPQLLLLLLPGGTAAFSSVPAWLLSAAAAAAAASDGNAGRLAAVVLCLAAPLSSFACSFFLIMSRMTISTMNHTDTTMKKKIHNNMRASSKGVHSDLPSELLLACSAALSHFCC
jgi:hypothetical protein